VVAAEAARCGWAVPAGLRVGLAGTSGTAPAVHDRDEPATGPNALGRRYEAALAPEARAAGAHYTPADVAARLADLVLAPGAGAGWHRADVPPSARVWDPACGGGAFLLAAADALLAAGGDPERIVAEQLWGTDTDPGAVAVAEAALCWWAHRHGVDARPGDHLADADPLLDPAAGDVGGPLARAAATGFDVVLGNPPFQGQLTGSSVRTPAATAALRSRLGAHVVRPYTDTAALFLVLGARALAPGGRLLLVQPTSVLAARDAAAARAAAQEVAELHGLWVAGEPVFDAAVQVCAVLLERPTAGVEPLAPAVRVVRRWRGRDVRPVAVPEPGPDTGASRSRTSRSGGRRTTVEVGMAGVGERWAASALAAMGVPDPVVRVDGHLGAIATARAGFRDEYYGLVGHVHEAPPDGAGPEHGRLVTAGLVDPGRCRWGERPASFARHRYERPVVDVGAVRSAGGRAAAWVGALAVPKVVVATQTRVGEAAVDEDGTWVASTPTVAVVAEPHLLWRVAAVVCSPVGTIAALAATAGTARAGDAIRHGVASVEALPLPVDDDAWDAGADALRRLDRDGFLAAMAAAYGSPRRDDVDGWWAARAPWPDGS
jgi:hypothetical protein